LSDDANPKNYSEATLLRAVEPTAQSVDRIILESPRSLRGVLTQIRDRFHETSFAVDELRESVGASRWWFTKFRRHVGLTPWRLVQELRMELGMRLLRDTPIYVKDVAYLVGYEDFSNFSHLCERWCRLKPAELRDQLRQVRQRLQALPEDALTWSYWRRAVSGRLSGDEARQLISYLEANTRR